MPTKSKRTQRPAPERLAYSILEFAKAIGVNRTTVWRQIGKKHIRTVRIGDREMVPAAELRRLKLTEM